MRSHLLSRPIASITRWADRAGNASPGMWALFIAVVGALIYLPRLGAYPLWDPWEPHYTQVAWEMQQQDTLFNPHYRGNDNWWSKPILMLWMLRASLGLFWDSVTNFGDHEWAARLPFALSAIAGGVLQFDWVRRLFGQPVGVLAALLLITAPQYVMIGRQVMADMPFLIPYAASLGYLAVGLFTKRDVSPDTPRWRAELQGHWPIHLFWFFQALAMLAKGFVPPVLAVLVIGGYAIATFRWRDYAQLIEGRRWGRYFLQRGAFALGVAGLTFLAVHLLPTDILKREWDIYAALLSGTGCLGIALAVFHDFPLSRHAIHVLQRMRALYGLGLFFVVGAPWYIYMAVKHGWPYWNEFIYYHHLGRAAGTIEKPGGTFDVYVRHLAFAMFPWSAFGLVAIWRVLPQCSALRSIANRRNLFVLLSALLPYVFFTLSGTKFAHYIFPIVPFVLVLIAYGLWSFTRNRPLEVPLAEMGPAIGPRVNAHNYITPWWWRNGARGEVLVVATTSLVIFGILCSDLVADFRHIPRLMLYYYNRATPPDYHPFVELQLIFFPLGIVIATMLFTRSVSRWQLAGLSAGAAALSCYISWAMLPALGSTYSYRPFYDAYNQMAKPTEPIGEFTDWQQPVRSVIFLFQNRAAHLRNESQAKAFLKRPGRKFVLVHRNRLSELRELASSVDKKLYVVFDDHAYGRMVSDVPNAEDTRRAANDILKTLPATATPTKVNFNDEIALEGWEFSPSEAHPGDTVNISLYFRSLKETHRDWQIFIHGTGPRRRNLIPADHYPVKGIYPTLEWREGELIRDRFTIHIPHDYQHRTVNIFLGFYIGNERMQITSGPSDKDNRAIGPRIPVVQ